MEHEITTVRTSVEASFPPELGALLRRAAEIEGRSINDFVVAAASAAARRTIEDVDLLRLSAEDQQRFAEALINPPPMNAAMRKGIATHRKLIAAVDSHD